MFALLFSLACTSAPPATCDQLAGLEADRCLAEELGQLGPDQLAELRAKAESIQDPIVRSAALDGWLRDHAQSVPHQDAMQLCELLEGPARGACVKRINAAHLNR